VKVDAPATGVRAGQPFTVVLKARVPLGSTVAFPVGPDSGVVEAVTSAVTDTRPLGPDSLEVRATYRLVAWEVGARTVPFGEAVVEQAGGARRVPIAPVPVAVESVLPGEGGAEPKPAREPIDLPVAWWRDALLVTLALLVGALLVWWALRRRGADAPSARRRRADPLAALDALARLGLDGAGEPARVLLGAADAVREALAQAHPASRVLTTEELVRTSLSGVPMPRVVSLLEDADAARYGRAPVPAERARRALAEARALVQGLAGAGVADRVGAAR
jgi:hypothetical protein